MLADCYFLRAALPRLVLLYDLSLLLLSAAALPVLRQCGLITVYRCTHQCGERSNAAFGTQSAAKQTSLAPHDSKARLQSVTDSRDSWRSHVRRTRLRSACSSSRCKLPMSGVEGFSPRLSLGDSKGVFSSEREYPLWCRGAHAALPPALTREKVQPFRAILPSARRAESTCAPSGAKKEHPYGCTFSNR